MSLPLLVLQGKHADLLLVPLTRGTFCAREWYVSGQWMGLWISGFTPVDEWNSFNLPSSLAGPSPQLTVVGRTRV